LNAQTDGWAGGRVAGVSKHKKSVHLLAAVDQTLLDRRDSLLLFDALFDAGDLWVGGELGWIANCGGGRMGETL